MTSLYCLGRIATKARPDGYDEVTGFVVAAESEARARAVAASDPGDEGADTWLDPAWSTCERIGIATDPREVVVLRAFNAG